MFVIIKMSEKFAICLYGHVRTWNNKCKDSLIKHILEPIYPVIPDIFVHTYDKNTNRDDNTIYYTQKQIKDMLVFTLSNGTVITPKVVVIQSNDEAQTQNRIESEPLFSHGDPGQTPNTYALVKKVYMCYEEMKKYEDENNFQYDYVMYTRFDNLITEGQFSLSQLTDGNTLYSYYSGAPDPTDELIFVIRNSNAHTAFISRFQDIFKVPYEHLWIGAVPTNCSHLLLRYTCVKCLPGSWPWNAIGRMTKQTEY